MNAPGVSVSIGPKESEIGIRARDFWAGLKVGKHKPEWGFEWRKDF